MFGDSSSSDDKREVKSKEQKMYEAFATEASKLERAIGASDWMTAADVFGEIMKQHKSSKNDLKKFGFPNALLWSLDFLLASADATFKDKDARKEMSKDESKALTKTRQQVQKALKQMKKQHEAWVAAGKPKADTNVGVSDGAADADDNDAGASGKTDGKGKGEGDEDSEYSYYSDDDVVVETAASRKNRWMVSDSDSEDDDAAAQREAAAKERADRRAARRAKREAKAAAADGGADEEDDEVTAYEVRDVLVDASAKRGRKNLDVTSQMEALLEVLPLCLTPQRKVEVLVLLCSYQLDVAPNMFSSISDAEWKSMLAHTVEILDILDANPNILMDPSYRGFTARTPAELDARKQKKNEAEGFVPPQPKLSAQEVEDKEAGIHRVSGSLRAFVERLDDEFTKSLQQLSAHGARYLQRMRDASSFETMAERAHLRLKEDERISTNAVDAVYCAYRRLHHLYYKRPDMFPNRDLAEVEAEIYNLCIEVFASNSEEIRQTGMIYLVTHYSLFDRYFKARDMLLMSHLQDIIHRSTAMVQIFFNRMMVQLGLCAFRAGLIAEAHRCLMTIASSKRIRELLAQGSTTIRSEADQEKEKIQRRRVLPPHLHINIELIDCTHLLCAMLLEIPNMAMSAVRSRRRVINKEFRRKLTERGPFTGPAETPRDHVIAGARALVNFDWAKTLSHLIPLAAWDIIGVDTTAIRELITVQVKEAALKTYFFKNGGHYASFSTESLVGKFELPEPSVRSVLSKLMISEQIHASWDQPTSSVVMHKDEMSGTQTLALQLAEKASSMVENNEKLMDDHNLSFDRFGNAGRGRRRRRGNNNGGGGNGGGKRGGGNGGGRKGGGRNRGNNQKRSRG